MLKTSYLFAALSLTSVIGGNSIMNQTTAHSWQPTWFEKKVVVNHNESKLAIKDGHDKWHMTISKDDLDVPNNAKAIDIRSFKFNYKLWFNVFKEWYDNGLVELNNDELAIATTILSNHDTTHNQLNLWVEGWNQFFSLMVHSSIEEIPNTFTSRNFGSFINSYNIYDFKTTIDYKYLLENEDNSKIENAVYNLFATEHDWGVMSFNTKQNVLNLALKKLQEKIPVRLHKYVSLSLIDEQSSEDFLLNPTASLKIRAIVFGRTLAYNLVSKEELKIKITNIRRDQYHDTFISIIEYLRRENWKINLDSIDSEYRKMDYHEISLASFQFFYKWVHKNYDLSTGQTSQYLIAYTMHDSDGFYSKILTRNHEVIGVIRFYHS